MLKCNVEHSLRVLRSEEKIIITEGVDALTQSLRHNLLDPSVGEFCV